MAVTESASKINSRLFEAGHNAKRNPYIQKLIEDKELRDNAVSALRSARKAFDRAASKGWDKNDLANDKKIRRDLEQAIKGIKQTRATLIEPPRKRKGGAFKKLFLLGVIGAIGAIATNEGLRKKVLDALFGAEEEFKYSSTTSTNGSS
ncbi:MAG: hypothetical protein WAO61_07255 [Solirubrobacterales bacterium]